MWCLSLSIIRVIRDTLMTKDRLTKAIKLFNGTRAFKDEDSKTQRNQPILVFLLDKERSALQTAILQKGMI